MILEPTLELGAATDATPSRGGRIRGSVPDELALKLLRMVEQRGENCRGNNVYNEEEGETGATLQHIVIRPFEA